MSVPAPLNPVVPEAIARVARAAFPKGNVCMRMHDELGPLSRTPQLMALFSHTGQPAADPARLALVLVMQFAEGLSDRQAADAPETPTEVQTAPAVEILRQVWIQQYYGPEDTPRWRHDRDIPPAAQLIHAPV